MGKDQINHEIYSWRCSTRRLAFSLGVDMEFPYKPCTLDCTYFQLGRTNRKEIVRKSYAQKDDILREIGESVNRRCHHRLGMDPSHRYRRTHPEVACC
jgi:wyosine [tRNA(Phe)-imidazoG37] synthetase (radical SAM superfamily)